MTLRRIALSAFLPPLLFPWLTAVAAPETVETDLLIVGATESGWAAAIQAARAGVPSITIVHDGEWFGGQYTEQALVCVDENKGVGTEGWGVDWHPMKRSFHRSGLFKELMDGIESLNEETYGDPMPGRPFHGPSTFRPAEAETVFREMIQPWLDSGQIRFLPLLYPVEAEVDGSGERPVLRGLKFSPVKGAEEKARPVHVIAGLTIDASDWGDAVQVAGAAREAGPDPRSRYGEPSAPEDGTFPPNEMNPITWAMIVEETDADACIPEPEHYDLRNYPRVTRISMTEFGQNLKWDRKLTSYGSILHWPDAGKESPRQLSVYTVRRIVDGNISRDDRTSILLNYMNGQDYPLERLPQRVIEVLEATEPGASEKNIVAMTREQRDIVFQDAKQHSLGVLYHLQTWVHDHAEDRTNSFRNFRLSREFGTEDHLPPKPYIRESLRLKALYMMREQDGRNRDGEEKNRARERFAHVIYPDGVFAWQFHYDFHRTGRTFLEDEGDDGPWIDYEKPGRHTRFLSDRSVFPLRSLIPVEMDGLLGAQKNVGYSSIVSAAIRLHDQCVAIGQAAGATAAVALKEGVAARNIPWDRDLLEDVRDALCGEDAGTPVLLWPWRDMPVKHPSFIAANRLAMLGCLPIGEREVDFQPDEAASPEWMNETLTLASEAAPGLDWQPEKAVLSRGEFCIHLWAEVRKQKLAPFPRQHPDDADADGIPDLDDPLPFTANEPIEFRIEPLAPEPDEDGVPGESSEGTTLVNFSGRDGNAPVGVLSDHGHPWDDRRGYGWSRDLSESHRLRKRHPNPLADGFIFTRDRDIWEHALPDGEYVVTVCVGDSGSNQSGQFVRVEDRVIVDREDTPAGSFLERTRQVKITDGRLTLHIGSGHEGSNTCLNWVQFRRLP